LTATTAASSTTSAIAAVSTNAIFYPVFVSTTTGNLALDVGTSLTYNPSTNTLAVGIVTLTADPTLALQAATKQYVDAVATGLSPKAPVTAATAAALPACTAAGSGVGRTLTGNAFGALIVDGITVTTSQRVLVKNQATGADDGIYTVTNTGGGAAYFVLTRATDSNGSIDNGLPSGSVVFVSSGTVNGSQGWVLTTANPVVIDTTSQTWVQFSASGSYTNGTGITITGNVIAIDATVLTTGATINGGTF
jgi:hypothetical protein